MFGTMGISELIIILVIVLIIFGAGKLPQIGEGVGKALRGFKKEVNDNDKFRDPHGTKHGANPYPWQDAEKVRQLRSRIAQRLNVPKRTPRLFARCGLAGRPF